MDQIDRILSAPPFNLDGAGRGWVRSTLAGMTEATKVRQLFVHLCFGTGPEVVDRITALAPGGITKFFGPDAGAELDTLDTMRAAAAIPYLISADLEGSRMSLPFGTEVPNPLALAAVDDVDASANIARIMAVEARAAGINWSFTPTPCSARQSWQRAASASTPPASGHMRWPISGNFKRTEWPPRQSTGPAKAMTTATSTCLQRSTRCR